MEMDEQARRMSIAGMKAEAAACTLRKILLTVLKNKPKTMKKSRVIIVKEFHYQFGEEIEFGFTQWSAYGTIRINHDSPPWSELTIRQYSRKEKAGILIEGAKGLNELVSVVNDFIERVEEHKDIRAGCNCICPR